MTRTFPPNHDLPYSPIAAQAVVSEMVAKPGKDFMSASRSIALLSLVLFLTSAMGCGEHDQLIGPQATHRASFGDQALPNPPQNSGPLVYGYTPPPALRLPPIPTTAGMFTFTVPDNVTQFEKQTGRLHEYLLYMGNPTPDQKPFVTLILAHSVVPVSHANPAIRANHSRKFLLNGLVAREWTGHTADGKGFAEICVTSPDGGGELDAVAVIPNERIRHTAMAILKSIRWQTGTTGNTAAGK